MFSSMIFVCQFPSSFPEDMRVALFVHSLVAVLVLPSSNGVSSFKIGSQKIRVREQDNFERFYGEQAFVGLAANGKENERAEGKQRKVAGPSGSGGFGSQGGAPGGFGGQGGAPGGFGGQGGVPGGFGGQGGRPGGFGGQGGGFGGQGGGFGGQGGGFGGQGGGFGGQGGGFGGQGGGFGGQGGRPGGFGGQGGGFGGQGGGFGSQGGRPGGFGGQGGGFGGQGGPMGQGGPGGQGGFNQGGQGGVGQGGFGQGNQGGFGGGGGQIGSGGFGQSGEGVSGGEGESGPDALANPGETPGWYYDGQEDKDGAEPIKLLEDKVIPLKEQDFEIEPPLGKGISGPGTRRNRRETEGGHGSEAEFSSEEESDDGHLEFEDYEEENEEPMSLISRIKRCWGMGGMPMTGTGGSGTGGGMDYGMLRFKKKKKMMEKLKKQKKKKDQKMATMRRKG